MSNKRKNKLNKDYYVNYWQLRLMHITCNIFKWKNVPKEINVTAMEKQIMLKGYAIFFKDKMLDRYFALGGALSGVDVYGYPSNARPIALGINDTQVNSYDFGNYEVGKDAVIIYCNAFRTTANDAINEYADKLANIDVAIKMNTNAMKKPIWLKGSEQTKSSLETFIRQYDDDYWCMLTDKSLGVNGEIEVLNLGVSAIEILNLQKQKENLLNEFYQIFGIQSTVEKRERVVSGEINAMQGQTAINRSVWLQTRQEAIEEINDLFNLNIECNVTQFEETNNNANQDENKNISTNTGEDVTAINEGVESNE